MKLIQSDFPIFSNNSNLVYLDSASSTQKPQYVIDKTSEYISSSYANIGRGSYKLAEQSDNLYYATKDKVAKLLNAQAAEIVFTYNTTYAINLLAQAFLQSDFFQAGDEIILSITEHHANILVRQQIAKTHDLEIKWLGVDENLELDLGNLSTLVNSKTKLISLTLCSNVLGLKNNLKQVRTLIGDKVFFLVDGAQAVPNYQVDVQELGCDALVFSAHKFLAYTGLGILYLKKSRARKLKPGLFGGGIVEDVSTQSFSLKQEIEKFEPGTPNVISIVSLYYALEYRESIGGYNWWNNYEQELIGYVLDRFLTLSDKLFCINKKANNRVGIFSFAPKSISKTITQITEYLALQNICVRSGGHCAYPLAKELGLERGSIRLSLYIYNTKEDIDRFFDVLTEYL